METAKFGRESGTKQIRVCGVEKLMPKPSAKPKAAKPKKIKLVAKNVRPLKAAIDAWVQASEKTDCDALNLEGAPVWAENALAEMTKVVLPGKRLPTQGECDAEFIGELIGRQNAFAKLMGGEIPMSAEMQADLENLKKRDEAQPKTPKIAARKKMLAKDFLNMIDANDQAIPALMAAMFASSHEDALKFQKGLLRGMNLVAEELDAGKIFQRHTRIFWVLGMQWQCFSKCNSVADVYYDLCEKIGFKEVGSLKTFEERIARKIGMKFRGRGRPKGT